MKKLIITKLLVCTLLVGFLIPLIGNVNAGTESDPELKDRILDVRFNGFLPLYPQILFKYLDIVSVWFEEKSDNPDIIYVSLKLRDIVTKTDSLEVIYLVGWFYQNEQYICSIHIHPEGVYGNPYICRQIGNDEYDNFHVVECTLDVDKYIVTWEVPKDTVGNPAKGHMITGVYGFTNNRATEESGLPRVDLFKDLTWNAKSNRDYKIQY